MSKNPRGDDQISRLKGWEDDFPLPFWWDTVDGRNPAPVDRLLCFTGFHT